MSYDFEFTASKNHPWTDEQRREAADELRRIADIWNTLLCRHEQDHESISPLGAELLSHVSPNFVAKADNYRARMSWTELRSAWLKDALEHTKMKLEIERLSTYVDEEMGTAVAYREQKCTGFQSHTQMKTFSEIRYELKNGKWMVKRFHVMRGHTGLSGYV